MRGLNALRLFVLSQSLALFFFNTLAHSENETITFQSWDQTNRADWLSNSSIGPDGSPSVMSHDPQTQANYLYDSVDEYLKGVLNAELVPGKWGRGIALQQTNPAQWTEQGGYREGYKAQAIAARNNLINWRKRNYGANKFWDVVNSEGQQVDSPTSRDDFRNHVDAIAGDAEGIVIKYAAFPEYFTEATFFSNTSRINRDSTLDSENAIAAYPWNYKPYLRSSENLRSDETSETNGAALADPGGHGVGMSQFGAMHLSKHDSFEYQQILQHYYHASPPYVKKLIIKQDTTIVHLKEWEDQFLSPFDPLLGRREKPGSVNLPVDSSQDLSVEVYYSEDVGNAFPVTMNIEGCASAPAPHWLSVDLTFRTIETVGGTKYYNRATGAISKSNISAACLGAGTHQIRLTGRHKYVGAWALDSNPATVSFDGSEVPTRHEQGSDLNHQLLVRTTPPKKPTSVEGKAGNGRARFTWAAPTEDTAGHSVADPLHFRLYYSRDPNDAIRNSCRRRPNSGKWSSRMRFRSLPA